MHTQDIDDTPSVVVERAKREHMKNKGKAMSNEEARHARITRKAKLEQFEDDDDWRDYIDR